MSALITVARPESGQDAAGAPTAPSAVEFHYIQTESFACLLRELGASLLVTTYQANKLLVVRAAGGGLSTLVRTFDRPMGLAANARSLALGTRNQIWLLRNAPDIAPRVEPAGLHDACYLPRSCHITGDIGIHELAWAGSRDQESGVRGQKAEAGSSLTADSCLSTPELWAVNTRFSCLCT